MLTDLSAAGLTDVAFHVDLTQQRKGYRSEEELNAIREKYIERARGLPLAVFFNTTIYAGNFHDSSLAQLRHFKIGNRHISSSYDIFSHYVIVTKKFLSY